MKNLTGAQKEEILKTVRGILDRRDVDIHFQMSREMKEEASGDGTTETAEPTGALAVCLSVKSSPSIRWASDIEAENETAGEQSRDKR